MPARIRSFSRDGELRIDFAGHLKQFVVELRAEEERRAQERIEFWTNRLEQAHALRCDQRTKSANHIQAGCLSRASCGKVVENDPVGLEFDGERQCLPVAVTKRRRSKEAGGMALGVFSLSQIGRVEIEGVNREPQPEESGPARK
jgi:hypothetical protein